MIPKKLIRRVAAMLVLAMMANLLGFALQPAPRTMAQEPEPSGSEVEEVQETDCPGCAPKEVSAQEDDPKIYLPILFKGPSKPPPGEKVTSGALDLKRTSDWGVQAQVTALVLVTGTVETTPTIAVAQGATMEERLTYMVSHANAVPDTPQVYTSTVTALAEAPSPPVSAQGWEGLSFTTDPQERSSGVYKDAAGKWVVPPGNWATWWHSGSYHPEADYTHILASAPGGAKAFVGVVGLDTGEYFGSNWQYGQYGGWSYLSSHVGWLDLGGRLGVTISNTGSSGNLTIQETPYGVTSTEIPEVGQPWEAEFKGYESGIRQCIYPSGESIHWHCERQQSFLRLGAGETLIGAEVWQMTESEFNSLLAAGVTAIPLGKIETAGGPIVIVLVVVGGLAAAAYLGLVAYQATARYYDGSTRHLYFPLEPPDIFRDVPAVWPTGVRTKSGVEIPGIVILTDQSFIGLRANAANAWHEYVYDGEAVWDSTAPKPIWMPYNPPSGAAWSKVNVQTAIVDAGVPDPRDFCKDRYNFAEMAKYLYIHKTIVDGQPLMVLELRDVGSSWTARLSMSYEPTQKVITSMAQTRGPYGHAGRAQFLMMVRYKLYADYLKEIGRTDLLDAPHRFTNIQGLPYSCYRAYLDAAVQAGQLLVKQGINNTLEILFKGMLSP